MQTIIKFISIAYSHFPLLMKQQNYCFQYYDLLVEKVCSLHDYYECYYYYLLSFYISIKLLNLGFLLDSEYCIIVCNFFHLKLEFIYTIFIWVNCMISFGL